ncbi:MAG: DUF3127 domain-containing protein, partial [Sphingobacteriales bacterium]
MAFDVTGKLVAKFDVVQRTENFRTREFVIEVSENIGTRTITNFIKFQSVQDRTELIDAHHTGDTVKVHFNIRGTKWEKNGQTNYITNLDAWRIEKVAMGGTEAPPPPPEAPVGDAGSD